jgi:GT2 family glycosyltransferase
MAQFRIAALLTCHNRREKTAECLRALRAQVLPGWKPGAESEKRKTSEEALVAKGPSKLFNAGSTTEAKRSDAKSEKLGTESGKQECPCASSPVSPGGSASSSPPAFDAAPPSSSLSSAGTPVASPAPPSSFPDNDKALPRGCSTFSIEVFLVDDGCTDGTADAVREVWPEATISQGTGNLFWCGGMRVAWAEAAKTDPDYYLLLNDDTIILPEALSELIEIAPAPSEPAIAVAAIADPDTQKHIYGGIRYGGEAVPVRVSGKPEICHTMNANCALVPREVFQRVGIFLRTYTHGMGDWDYGNAARRKMCSVVQSRRILGFCQQNKAAGAWKNTALSRHERYRLLVSTKSLPFREWVVYCFRNTGWAWPYYIFSPYLRILLKQ